MQTEFRLRLLRKDEASPSGYRIVGYLKINNFIWYSVVGRDYKNNTIYALLEDDFEWDAFDLGVKIGDEWYYEGDRADFDTTCDIVGGTIIFTGYTWYFERGDGTRYKLANGVLNFITRTGRTIHDEE